MMGSKSKTQPSQHSKPPVQPQANSVKRWGFRLVAMLGVPAFLLAAVEIVLAMVGIGYPTGFLVPAAEQQACFVDNYKFAWRFFPKQLARTPQPVRAQRLPANGTKRIVVLGGSAAMGDPEPAFGAPRILETLLEQRFPKIDFEVVNAAATAINSHVVQSIAADCRKLKPDAWIVYLGNNEVHGPFGAGTVFGRRNTPRWLIRAGLGLQRTRIGQLATGIRGESQGAPAEWGGMEMFLQSQVAANDPALDRVYRQCEANLAAILALTTSSDAITLVSTVATNLRDSAPFASKHASGLSFADLQSWQAHFDQGCQAQDGGAFETAQGHFLQAVEIDAQFAELHFRLGQCQLALGLGPQAKTHFTAARDLDTLRFRADTEIITRIRQLVQSHASQRVALIDAERLMSELAVDGCPGEEFFHEHVHFNFAGNYQLALAFADALASRWGLLDQSAASEKWLTMDECQTRLGFSPLHQLLLTREMQSRLSAPPFSQQAGHQNRLQRLQENAVAITAKLTDAAKVDSRQNYERLVAERPNDWELREQFAVLLESLGLLEDAAVQIEEVTRLIPHRPEPLVQLGRLWNRQQKWVAAEQPLRRALELRPDFARAANSLGIALSQQKKFDESIAWFQKSTDLQPTFGEAFYNWGLVLQEQGHEEAAIAKLQAAVAADPRYYPAHDRLAKGYVANENWLAALPHYQAVAKLQPFSVNSQLNLGLLYVKLIDGNAKSEHLAEAITQFETILRLDPNHQYAKSALQHLSQWNADKLQGESN